MEFWPFPRVVAHRGGGVLAPENTLAAMRCAAHYGFHAVEFDVMLAHDGVPVVIHDTRLGRTVAGDAEIASLSSVQLGAMDAGSWFDTYFCGERVPTFEQVFSFCRSHSIWMNIEIKPTPGSEAETGRMVASLARRWIDPNDRMPPLLSSFSFDALMSAKAAAPMLPRGLLVERIPADWQAQLHRSGAVALHANHAYLCAEVVDEIKAAGIGLFCYTVDEPPRAAQLFAWGVDAVCTNRLDLIEASFGDLSASSRR